MQHYIKTQSISSWSVTFFVCNKRNEAQNSRHTQRRRSNWWLFPRPQMSPSIATEAFQVACLSPIVGGPVFKTGGVRDIGYRWYFTRRVTQHIGAREMQTRIVHYREWDGRLHLNAAHPERSRTVNKVMIHIKNDPIPDPVQSVHPNLTASLLKYCMSLVNWPGPSNTHYFLPNCPNWTL